nr:glycosyltransferase 61 family protein [uncultured Rhodopila sp.]
MSTEFSGISPAQITFLYNVTHSSFLVYDEDNGKLKQVSADALSKESLASLVCMTQMGEKPVLTLHRRPDRFLHLAIDCLISICDEASFCENNLTIHYLSSNKIAISGNGNYLCAERGGSVSISRKWVREWETFELLSRRAALDLVDEKLSAPFPLRHKSRFLQTTRRVSYGDKSFSIKNARVVSTDWIILDGSGCLFVPRMTHLQRSHGRGVVLYPTPKYTRQARACLIGGYQNYYHHLAEDLVNLFAVRDQIDDTTPLLTTRIESKFQSEIAQAFGIESQIFQMDDLSSMKVDDLLVPERAIVEWGVVRNPFVLRRCAEYLGSKLNFKRSQARRLFISRARARSRRALNEKAAVEIAKEFGFEELHLEDLSFTQQFCLFSEAEAVVALHGAGFANLIFAETGCLVIEIMPSSPFRPDFFRNLANGLGHRFERVYAKGGFASTELEIDISELTDVLGRNLSRY